LPYRSDSLLKQKLDTKKKAPKISPGQYLDFFNEQKYETLCPYDELSKNQHEGHSNPLLCRVYEEKKLTRAENLFAHVYI